MGRYLSFKNNVVCMVPIDCIPQRGVGGWGEVGETRSATEKRCSHELQSGNFALPVCIFHKVNISEVRSEPAEEIIQY